MAFNEMKAMAFGSERGGAAWAEMLVSVYTAEAAAALTTGIAAAHLIEAARLTSGQLGDTTSARRLYRQALQHAPGHPDALRGLTAVATQDEDHVALRSALERELISERDDGRRLTLLVRLGALLQDHFEGLHAYRVLKQAAALSPDDPVLLARLSLALPTDKPRLWADHLARLVPLVGPGAPLAAIQSQRGQILEAELSDISAAAEAYEAALEAAPERLDAMAGLCRTLGHLDEWLRLLDVLELASNRARTEEAVQALVGAAVDVAINRCTVPKRAASLLLRLSALFPDDSETTRQCAADLERLGEWEAAAILFERLGRAPSQVEARVRCGLALEQAGSDADAVVDGYRRALDTRPEDVNALLGTARVAWRTEDWPQYQSTLEALGAAAPASFYAGLLVHLGDVAEHLQDDENTARRRYSAAMALEFEAAEPGLTCPVSLAERHRLLHKTHPKVVAEDLRSFLNLDPEPASKALALDWLACLYEARLDEPAEALATNQALLAIDPQNQRAQRAMVRLLAKAGAPGPLLLALDADRRSRDSIRSLAALSWSADLYRAGQDETQEAACWRRALEIDPDFLPAIRGLGQLLFKQKDWEQLADLYRYEVDRLPAEDPERPLVLARLGELYELRLGQLENAASVLEEICQGGPHGDEAEDGLLRIYSRLERWTALARVLESRVSVTENPWARATLLLRLSRLAETRQDDPARALELCVEAYSICPDLLAAMWTLERIYLRQGDQTALRALYRDHRDRLKLGPQRAVITHKLAALLPEAEAVSVVSALVQEHGDLDATWRLVRTAASAGEDLRLSQELDVMAGHLEHDQDRIAVRLEAAEASERAGADAEVQQGLWNRLLSLDPGLDRPWEALLKLGADAGEESFAAVLRRLGQVSSEARTRSISLWAAGDLEARAGRNGLASDRYADAASATVDDPVPAWRLLAQPGLSGVDALSATVSAELSASLGRRLRDPVRAAAALREAAALRLDVLGDKAEGMRLLVEAVVCDPADESTALQAEALLQAEGAYVEIEQLLRVRIGRLSAPTVVIPLLKRLAEIQINIHRDREAACQTWAEIAVIAPDEPDVRMNQAALNYGLERWEKAVEIYGYAIGLTQEPEVLALAHSRIGRIKALHLGAPMAAIEHLRLAVSYKEEDPRPLEVLAQLYLDTGDPVRALRAYERLERLADDHARVAEAKAGQVRALMAGGRTSAAKARLKRAQAGSPGEPVFASLDQSIDQSVDASSTDMGPAPPPLTQVKAGEHRTGPPPLSHVTGAMPPPLNMVQDRASKGGTGKPPLLPPPLEQIAQTAAPLLSAQSTSGALSSDGSLAAAAGLRSGESEAQRLAESARARLSTNALDRDAWRDLAAAVGADPGSNGALDWVNGIIAWIDGVPHTPERFEAPGPLPDRLRALAVPTSVPRPLLKLLREVGPAIAHALGGRTPKVLVPVEDDTPLAEMARRAAAALGVSTYELALNQVRPYSISIVAGDPTVIALGEAVVNRADAMGQSYLVGRCLVPVREGTLPARIFGDREFKAFLGALTGMLGAKYELRARDRTKAEQMRARLEPEIGALLKRDDWRKLAREVASTLADHSASSVRKGLEMYASRVALSVCDGLAGVLDTLRLLDFDERPREALTHVDLEQFLADNDLAHDLLVFAGSPACLEIRNWLAG